LLLVLAAGPCLAGEAAEAAAAEESGGWQIDEWFLFTSLYTKHFHPDPDHVDDQKMIGLEIRMKNQWLFGLASFDNSFGQRSEYLYGGYKWDLFQSDHWYFKLTGGLLYGYKEPYEDKIPLNDLGVAPAILPSLGFQYGHGVAEVHLGGLSVLNVTAGIAF